MQCYAHSREGHPPAEWQPLEDHLRNVADLAARFAEPFGGQGWARLAGLWHDLGKYSNEFQKKLYEANGIECHLETKPGRVVHSEAGGHLASLKGWRGVDRLLSWVIMGHHAGLADFYPEGEQGAAALETRMRHPESSEAILERVPDSIKNQPFSSFPLPKRADPAFFIRMLFSCVVDADFLDTEAFMDRRRKKMRNTDYPELASLIPAFDAFMSEKSKQAQPTPVNRIRAEVLAQCRQTAQMDPAVFSLSVPTGGGKTLSSLAFALNHAVLHKKRRIIYVIPYTSIIEQTAQVFRDIPGFEAAIIEHHSTVVEEDESKETVRMRLATENWDAPIIVTTAVQFFESLFACKTSRCRKLHNMANSVVVFDEAQCFPPEYLRPSVFAIRELFRFYKVTPLLCTATQPVLTQTERFDFRFREGFENVVEIIPRPEALSRKLQRVEVAAFDPKPLPLPLLADALLAENQATLCIVNRKEDARELAKLLPEKNTLHLSTNMCAAHRLDVLNAVRQRRKTDTAPLIVVSTSLVEAGVDLDFPVVYRALAGLDSIAQAAGRCNREGLLSTGKTVVFVPENQPRYVRQPADLSIGFLRGDLSDVLSPANYAAYFRQRFWQLGEEELDRFGILKMLSGRMDYSFRASAREFRFIRNDWQSPVIVPFGEAHQLIDRMIIEKRETYYLRRLQRYTIGIGQWQHGQLRDRGFIHECAKCPGLFTLNPALYDSRFGFAPPESISAYNPDNTIC